MRSRSRCRCAGGCGERCRSRRERPGSSLHDPPRPGDLSVRQRRTGSAAGACSSAVIPAGGAFCYDPWVLYARRRCSTTPTSIVLGKLGQGKSSLVKTLLWRMLLFGRRAFVLDVKREYGPLCDAVGVRPISLVPGGERARSTRSPPGPRSTPSSSCCAR